ncbi:MAG: glycosyltransferase [Bdellovibrionota bacterium]
MTKSITILTSRLNYGWISMEEIITWIEDSWKRWAFERGYECHFFMAEDTNLNQFAKAGLKSEFIVVTCFNSPISRALKGIRGSLGIQTPWVYYLHGLASFGCWPLFNWGIGDLIHTHDLFVGSCSRDKKQFELIFKNIECRIIPFSLNWNKSIPERNQSGTIRLAFIGRISSQKNLHTLLVAASQLKKNFELHFFGKPDDYGSPLVGRREKDYQVYLENLSREMNLKNIFFHGFMKREEIESLMDKELWTFIAPSIHSDENFGMAAFRCLLNGHRVILSDWGGHADYPAHFPGQVELLPVKSSEVGPYISVEEMVSAIEASDQSFSAPSHMPEYYSELNIHGNFDSIRERMEEKKHLKPFPLEVTVLLEKILTKRNSYLAQNEKSEGIQIFDDYRDVLLQVFYEAYGMRTLSELDSGKTKLLPWVTETNEGYEVEDPHRGKFRLPKKSDLLRLGLLY